MSAQKTAKKTRPKKLSVRSLEVFADLKAGGEPIVTGTGKKKKVTPSETG